MLSALAITILLSLFAEVFLFRRLFEVMLTLHNLTQAQEGHFLQFLGMLILSLILLAPLLIFLGTLVLAAVQFGKSLTRWYQPPLQELRKAVENIKQQNLDFTIAYDGSDELGDLCRAVNELRSQLQASLLREWNKEEETREMVAALSHDLRTPVATLQGYIETLASTSPEKRIGRLERYLPALEGNVQRLAQLLDDMLMVASLDQSGFVLQPHAVKLEQELERKAAAYTLRCTEHHIAFHYQSHKLPGLGDDIIVDYHRIEQVLDNLFENALRFTPPNGSIVLTWVGNLNVHSFSISDSGRGIAEEDLPHIFEKYYSRSRQQAKGANKPKKSMGMGLYICKELVQLHNGSITAQNRPEGGCEISFWITPCLDQVSEQSYHANSAVTTMDA